MKNVMRAKEKDKRLQEEGWIVVYVWEYKLGDIRKVVKKIKKVLESLG